MKIFNLLFCFCCLGLIACSSEEKDPNIIYILTDDLGYGDVQAMNPDGKIPTPNLNQMAAAGMTFTDAHTASAVCTPTRYSILTGRYAWRSRLKSGVLTGKSKALIPKDRTTVASLLRDNAYHTAFIGKWHLGWDWQLKGPDSSGIGWNPGDFGQIDFTQPVLNGPNSNGFEYAYGHSGSLDMAPYVYVENGMVTAQPDTVTVNRGKYTWWREGPTGSDFVHEQVTPHFFQKAFDYIKGRTDDKPFFLYLALPSPHTPILPTEDWQGKSELNPYGDFVMMIDAYVGELRALLRAQGIADNTLLIFTSDNGCSPEADFAILGEKGHDPSAIFRGHKADIYEGGHRVPFIVEWPAKVAPGKRSDALICTTDLLATCAEITDNVLAVNQAEDSFSFLNVLENIENTPNRKDIIHHSINGSFAIRKGAWKYIQCAGSGGWSFPKPNQVAAQDSFPPVQLYNLQEDPEETNNLFALHPAKVDSMKVALKDYILNGRSTPGYYQANDPIDKEWKQIAFTKE